MERALAKPETVLALAGVGKDTGHRAVVGDSVEDRAAQGFSGVGFVDHPEPAAIEHEPFASGGVAAFWAIAAEGNARAPRVAATMAVRTPIRFTLTPDRSILLAVTNSAIVTDRTAISCEPAAQTRPIPGR